MIFLCFVFSIQVASLKQSFLAIPYSSHIFPGGAVLLYSFFVLAGTHRLSFSSAANWRADLLALSSKPTSSVMSSTCSVGRFSSVLCMSSLLEWLLFPEAAVSNVSAVSALDIQYGSMMLRMHGVVR